MLKISVPPITSFEDLLLNLQNAVRLEHATIPPYLTALYTLAGDSPSVEFARSTIKSIVVEEMLHMSLASNLLNALGGHPQINDGKFVAKYPGPLPMGVGDLTVPIAKYSQELVTNVFMEIEEPEIPIDIPLESAQAVDAHYETIGEFYTAIKNYILQHTTQTDFKGDPSYQLTDWFDDGELVKVTDAASAAAAIDTIIEQGEGTAGKPVFEEGDVVEYAHYYKFEELSQGRKIVPADNDVGYAFSGKPEDRIVIDPISDVINMVDNPAEVDYSDNPRAVLLSDQCDYIYTKVLNGLHIAFNGAPDTMVNALGTMFELKNSIGELLRVPLFEKDGQTVYAGPKYLFSETNPGA